MSIGPSTVFYQETYFIEAERFQNNSSTSRARGVLPRACNLINPRPLIDQQGLIAVFEPRQIAQPDQVRGHRAETNRKSSHFCPTDFSKTALKY